MVVLAAFKVSLNSVPETLSSSAKVPVVAPEKWLKVPAPFEEKVTVAPVVVCQF